MNWSNSTIVGHRSVAGSNRLQEVRSLNAHCTHAFKQPASVPRVDTTPRPISNDAMNQTCCMLFDLVAFAALTIAWAFARIFRCGKLGKMTWKQFSAKYKPDC